MQCTATPRVLVADDQHDVLEALRLLLRDGGCEPECVRSVSDVRQRLADAQYDLLLMDLNYARDTTSGREGLELLAEVHARDRLMPIIVMTGWGTVETAVEAMRRGARTFVQKPWDNASLIRMVQREVAEGLAIRRAGALVSRELNDAKQIQRALLPASLPSIPGCDLAAIWQPASEFGGDCYDVMRLGPTTLGISIGDVAGKGLPAAMLMANLQALGRAFGSGGSTPQQVAGSVNRALCHNAGLETLVTFFYAVVDPAARAMTFSNAGHNPPILVRADGSVDRLATGGLLLGVARDAVYEERQVALAPGDRLVLFTDGLTEAEREDGNEFGDERLVETVVAYRCESARALADAVFAEVRTFTGAAFRDDATMVVGAIE